MLLLPHFFLPISRISSRFSLYNVAVDAVTAVLLHVSRLTYATMQSCKV